MFKASVPVLMCNSFFLPDKQKHDHSPPNPFLKCKALFWTHFTSQKDYRNSSHLATDLSWFLCEYFLHQMVALVWWQWLQRLVSAQSKISSDTSTHAPCGKRLNFESPLWWPVRKMLWGMKCECLVHRGAKQCWATVSLPAWRQCWHSGVPTLLLTWENQSSEKLHHQDNRVPSGFHKTDP